MKPEKLTIAIFFTVGCGARLTDHTETPFTYHPPINEQEFRVEVNSNSTISSVRIQTSGVDTRMSWSGEFFTAILPTPVCASAIDYKITVASRSGTQTFPPVGAFTREVVGLPAECEAHSANFAQTFVVDATEDFVDNSLGDGRCRGVSAKGVWGCSLRAAIMEANAKHGHDLVVLDSRRYRLSLVGKEGATDTNDAMGDLDLNEAITIQGPEDSSTTLTSFVNDNPAWEDHLSDNDVDTRFPKVDGGGRFRIFHIAPEVDALIARLAVVNGGGDAPGGGIYNAGRLQLEKVALIGNLSSPRQSGEGGGGIRNTGQLFAQDLAVTQNRAGAIGGGLHNTGTAVIERAVFAFNQARVGAASFNTLGGKLKLANATMFGNHWMRLPPVNILANQGTDSVARYLFITIAGHFRDSRRLISGGSEPGSLTYLGSSLTVHNTSGPECEGNIHTLGGNVFEDFCSLPLGRPRSPDHQEVGTIVGADGELVDHGGFLPVIGLSPTTGRLFNPIDKSQMLTNLTTDQRGEPFARWVDGDRNGTTRLDAGAFEFAP